MTENLHELISLFISGIEVKELIKQTSYPLQIVSFAIYPTKIQNVNTLKSVRILLKSENVNEKHTLRNVSGILKLEREIPHQSQIRIFYL